MHQGLGASGPLLLFSHSVGSDSLRPHGLQHFQAISQSLLKLMSVELVMPSNHLTLCPLLLLPSIFPSIRFFSNEPVVLTPQKSAPHPSRPHKQVSEWLRLHRAVRRALRGVQPWLCPIWGWWAGNSVDAVIGLRGLLFSDLEIRNWTK